MASMIQHPGDAARDMEQVLRALFHAEQLATSVDRFFAALQIQAPPAQSALSTLLQHAQQAAERVQGTLRGLDDDRPPPSHAHRKTKP